jgi:Phosphoadenosine phosphosulfate reductase family
MPKKKPPREIRHIHGVNMRFVIRASYGNDSVALIQWAREEGLSDVVVLYSDTGWARESWTARVEQMEAWVKSLGYTPARTHSIGMKALVEQKKMFPQRLMQFCTKELKILPTMAWLEKNDPERRAIILTGIRREESANRAAAPMFLINSANDGGRCVIQPLAHFTEADRNALLRRAGFEPLDHRSEECKCINSGRKDIKRWTEDDIAIIEEMEAAPLSSKGKPRTMFRPNKFMGATGIREVVRWAHSPPGKYDPTQEALELGEPCDEAWCGR